jgi:hypothetical protein
MDLTNINPEELELDASKMTRIEWHKWKTATFGEEYMIWHDGLELSGVVNLKGEEREKALVMLRRGVEFGDRHCGTALAAMQGKHILLSYHHPQM